MQRHLTSRKGIALSTLVVLILLLSLLIFSRNFLAAPIPLPEPINTPFYFQAQIEQSRARGELQQALYLIEAQAARDGWTAEQRILAGNLWRDIGDISRALPYWEAAVVDAPTPELLRQLADLTIQQGRWDTAWSYLEALIRFMPEDAWALYHAGALITPYNPTLGTDYLSRLAGRVTPYSEIALDVLIAAGSDPTDLGISARVGAALAAKQSWSLAENSFRYAEAINYPFPEAIAYIGLMRAQQGKNGDAWIAEAINLAPGDPNVRYVEGVYARAQGNFEYSAAALLLAVSLAPQNPVFYAELGNTYQAMGNLNEAEYWLRTAVDISSGDPILTEALERFRNTEAFLMPQDLLSLTNPDYAQDSNNPTSIAAEGWTLHLDGQSEAGLARVEEALALEYDNPRALYDKARILLETERQEEALPILQQLADGQSIFAQPAQRLLANLDES